MPYRPRRGAPVCTIGLLLASSAFGQPPGDDFFDDTVIHDIRINVDPGDWAALRNNYLEDTYYHADISSGTLAAADVGIRSRGRGSRSPDKPNLDVNVDKYT